MRRIAIISIFSGLLFGILSAQDAVPVEPTVIPHENLKQYVFNGNFLTGLATPKLGAKEFEVWRTSMAVGSSTPPHKHETEEIFVYLRGKGKAVIDGQEYDFEAPCTLILPPNVEHQLFNTGDEPTDAIVILGIDSKIYNHQDEEMNLPWRR